MGEVKAILCLANSKKHGGTCFAGAEVLERGTGTWVRPVSSRPGHEVNLIEQTLTEGSQPHVLDVITVGLLRPAPNGYQSENWLLDERHPWKRVDRWTFEDLEPLIDHPPTLWTNDSSSTVGIHDRVAEEHLVRHKRSICLIRPVGAQAVVATNRWSGNSEVRLWFNYNGAQYELKVTDHVYYAHFRARGAGLYPLSEQTLVTVSLAEPYTAPQPGAEAYSHKIVAAIFEPDGPPGGAS